MQKISSEVFDQSRSFYTQRDVFLVMEACPFPGFVFSQCGGVCVCVHRSGRFGGGSTVCLPGVPSCSVAALLLLQSQDFILPQVDFTERAEQEQVLSPCHVLFLSGPSVCS